MDIHIGNASYRVTRKMDAIRQFALMSKMSPLLASGVGEIVPLVLQLRSEGVNDMASIPMDRLGQIATPVARELAKMSEGEQRMIIGTCLELVDRRDDGKDGWQRVWSPEAKAAMFDEVNNNMLTMLRLVFHTLQEVYGDFFPASLSAISGVAKQ